MSSAKVTSGAPVGHSTTVAKLNGIRSASVASASATISSVGESANTGSATDQYLHNDDNPVNPYIQNEEQDVVFSLPVSPLSNDVSSAVQLQFQEDKSFYLSLQDLNDHIEAYERTSEQADGQVKKKTQGFG